MDLIYTDKDKIDKGVIEPVSFDMAFGTDENDFELIIKKKDHCCEADSVIYVEDEEYGGIVDRIRLSSDDENLTYLGRSFHGVLNSKVIHPPAGLASYVAYGDANEVIGRIITMLDLDDLFAASSDTSGINIVDYEFENYAPGYDSICKMLSSVSAKLKMKWTNRKVLMWAEPTIDYSIDEEFLINAVTGLNIEKNYKPPNHIIAIGSGEGVSQKVIHFFTDEGGEVQPYSQIDIPIKNSDYILDKRNQVLFGKNEVCEVVDCTGSEPIGNYEKLTSQPSDWRKNYKSYYSMNDNDEYTEVEGETEEAYELQTSQPSDWQKNFSAYYIKEDDGYNSFSGVETKAHKLLTSQPSDWKYNYSNYFTYFSDGATDDWRSVDGVQKNKYVKQTKQPSDWNTNFKSYYQKNKKGAFVAVAKKEKWKTKKFYTKYTYSVAPGFVKNKYYRELVNSWTPTWVANTYYTKTEKNIIPPFKSNTYFKRYEDAYAPMVEACLDRLQEAWNSDDVNIVLSPEQCYDIGDIVGGVDEITGISCARAVTKKIIKINSNGDFEIDYEEGTSN